MIGISDYGMLRLIIDDVEEHHMHTGEIGGFAPVLGLPSKSNMDAEHMLASVAL